MIRKIFPILILFLAPATVFAQPNKWFKKARKAQLTIITYDASGQIHHTTNGFYIDNECTVLTDYKSLKGAYRAVAIDDNGKEWPVVSISGASSLYDIAKIKVENHKITALPVASTNLPEGAPAYIMPYLSSKAAAPTITSVKKVETFNNKYIQYTLPQKINERTSSCPLLNDEGQVVGLVQMPANSNQECCFAISTNFALDLTITALTATMTDYRDIYIKKTLPNDASQALSFIYLVGTRDTSIYLDYVDDFITSFPSEVNGYTLKAEMLADRQDYTAAESTWDEGLKKGNSAADIYYSRAKATYAVIQKNVNAPESWSINRALADIDAAKQVNDEPIYTAMKGHLLYANKDYEGACKQFLSVTETKLRDANYFLYAANCQQMLGDTTLVLALQDSAVACYTRPYPAEAAPALIMRAQTHLSMNHYRQAVIDMNDYEHLMLGKLNASFYYKREQAELHCRMYQQALSDMEQAIRLEPQEPLFHAELASLHYRFGDMESAVSSAQRSVDLDSSFADAYRILGLSLKEQGNIQDSQKALQRAADLGDQIALKLLENNK